LKNPIYLTHSSLFAFIEIPIIVGKEHNVIESPLAGLVAMKHDSSSG
jgi:hypothetical protein